MGKKPKTPKALWRLFRIRAHRNIRKSRLIFRRNKHVLAPVLALLVLSASIFIYQNCAPASFSKTQETSATQASTEAPPTTTTTLPPSPQNDLALDLPSTLDFGKVRLSTTATRAVTIKNLTPSDSVLITAQVMGSDFVMDPASTCLQQALAPNASCVLNFSFTPTVTTAKTSTVEITAKKQNDPSMTLKKSVTITGSGLIIAPSSLDQLFLLGWYSHKETTNVSYLNRTADNKNCPAVLTPADPNADVSDYQGQQVEFCYEPSGAHGLQLATTATDQDAAGTKLKDYVLKDGSFESVVSLDDLFSSPAEHTSTNAALKEALFYYAMGYLNIPHKQFVDSQFDVVFNVHAVDDAIGMIINNRFAGYVMIAETWGTRQVKDTNLNVEYYDYPDRDFPVSLKLGKNNSATLGKNNVFASSPLKEGANTVTALWLDDRASQRNIVGAKLLYKSSETAGAYQAVPVYLPNVIQGYVYDSVTGNPISGASVNVSDAVSGTVLKTATTDSTGFYRAQGITDGNRKITFSKSGYTSGSETQTFNHKNATTAILEVSRGL